MAVIGVDTICMSHLPMFMPPHNYQVILRVGLTSSEADPETIYRRDRKAHEDTKLYTFAPARFVLPDLFPGEHGEPPRSTSFVGSLVRNHFEQPRAHPDPPEEIASDVTVNVLDVIHAHKFDPQAGPLEHLTYLLFGKGSERFMAHLISGAPDHDQLLSVAVSGHEFSDDDLRRGIEVRVPDRDNTPADRVKEGETGVAGVALVDGHEVALQFDAIEESYFETADLAEAM
jgi:hypothetical protein